MLVTPPWAVVTPGFRQVGDRADRNRIVQQCPAGLVALRSIDGLLAFKAPRLRRSGPLAAADLERVATILGIAATDIVASAWADNGPGWMAVLLASADAVLALQPSDDGAGHLDIGVVGFYPGGSDPAYEVRAFFSNGQGGLVEDPVTGSLNASLAQWLIASGRISAPYTASQGTLLGRTGRPRISQDHEGSVWVGGATHTIVEGLVDIE